MHYHFFSQWLESDGKVHSQLGPFTTEDREFAVKTAEDHIHHAHSIMRLTHGDGTDVELPHIEVWRGLDSKPGTIVEWKFTDPDGNSEVTRVVACDGKTRSDASLGFVEAMVHEMGGEVIRDNEDGTYIISLPDELDMLA